MPDLDLAKLATHFAQSKRAEGTAEGTISWYRRLISRYVAFIAARGQATSLRNLNVTLAREFIVAEQARNLSPFTVHGEVRGLKTFASWLLSEGYAENHLLANLKLPKLPEKIVEILTAAEMDRLIKCQNPLTQYGARDIAILVVLADSGIRVGEMTCLDLDDAHIEEGYLKVLGKGRKERLVPIGGTAQKVLWRYLIHFRPEPSPGHNRLLLTREGEPMSINATEQMMKRWGRRAGVPRLHPHLCRHTFATNFLINNCGDVFRLQQILGHTTLEMVRRYVHLASSAIIVTERPSSPLDAMALGSLRGHKVDRILKSNIAPARAAEAAAIPRPDPPVREHVNHITRAQMARGRLPSGRYHSGAPTVPAGIAQKS